MTTKYKPDCSNQGNEGKNRRYTGHYEYESLPDSKSPVVGLFSGKEPGLPHIEVHKWIKPRADGAQYFLVDTDHPTRYKDGFISNVIVTDDTRWFGYDGYYQINITSDSEYSFESIDTKPKRSK